MTTDRYRELQDRLEQLRDDRHELGDGGANHERWMQITAEIRRVSKEARALLRTPTVPAIEPASVPEEQTPSRHALTEKEERARWRKKAREETQRALDEIEEMTTDERRKAHALPE